MYELATRLFPIGRSLTGNGVRETLKIIQESVPLTIHEVSSGTAVFDWTVPEEWNVSEAYIVAPDGSRIADYAVNTLHLVGYSTSIDATVSLSELQEHLHSLTEQPDAIPYVTSYYAKRWGFCITDRQRRSLTEGSYRVHIDARHTNGSLTYGELVIPGKKEKEIFISTYLCHPSMANDNISGIVLAVALARWVAQKPREYTYRIIFIPETIGALVYLSKHMDYLRERVVAGFVLTCEGDDRTYSYLPSRLGNTLADRVALRVLREQYPDFQSHSFLKRGSDERQYCSPGVDLPVVSLMRSKYDTYPEYHTSLDDLSVVTPQGLQGSYNLHVACFEHLEAGKLYRSAQTGEPQLGRRGLYPTLSQKASVTYSSQQLLDILAYADGTRLPADIAEVLGLPENYIETLLKLLKSHDLLIEE